MWWILALGACLATTIKQMVMRTHGFSLLALGMLIGLLALSESGFWFSMRTSPSFFKPWFLACAALPVFGFVASIFFFKESPSSMAWTGATLAIIGSFLLIKG